MSVERATIFLTFLVLAIVPIFILIALTRPLEDKYKTLMNTKQIYILDPAGQKYLVTSLDSQEKTFEIFGKILAKKMFSFDYRGSEENIEFLRQYMSSESYQKIIDNTSTLRAEAKETSGYYKVKIKNYALSRKGDEYIMDIFFDHELISKAVSSKNEYMVKLSLISDSQTPDNYSGIYLNEYEIFTGDDLTDKKEEILNENK